MGLFDLYFVGCAFGEVIIAARLMDDEISPLVLELFPILGIMKAAGLSLHVSHLAGAIC